MVATVNAGELVRIRDEAKYSMYHSNFRFVITGSKGVARPKMEKTLEDPAEKLNFWRYNNGVTICCSSVTPVNPSKDKYEIKGLQVVNGLQTIETLWENKDRNLLTDDVKLLVRIIPTSSETSDKSRLLEEHIAEYSNSQTPITPRDLRANDPVQQQIERLAWEQYDLKYIRKVGQIPGQLGRPSGRDRIDNEDAAQATLSFWFGQSWDAKLNRKLLFELSTSAAEGFYDKIFKENLTTPEYVLLPAMLWDFEYKFIDSLKKEEDKPRKGVYRGTDLLAMTIFGELFRDANGLPSKPTTSSRVRSALSSAIFDLKNLRLQGGESEAKRCWKPILEAIYKVVEKRRRAEAKRRGVELDDVSQRNIYVNFKYPEVKKEIMGLLDVRAMRKTITEIIPCRNS